MKSKIWFALVALVLFSLAAFAQESAPVEMASGMYADGKIYVVITVFAVILTGLFIFLIRLDSKVSRLEKNK